MPTLTTLEIALIVSFLGLLLVTGFILVSLIGLRRAARPPESHQAEHDRAVAAADAAWRGPMRVLVATDGSPCSDAAVESVAVRPWPSGTRVQVVTVVHTNLPLVPEPFLTGAAAHVETLEADRAQAPLRLDTARRLLEASPVLVGQVEQQQLEGHPADAVVAEAERWNADLVVVGSHGHGGVKRLTLGSVSDAVVRRAPCSVEVVRCADAA